MKNRRKSKFVDHEIQGRLMAALITLEVLMVVVAMVYLYAKFNAIFDDSIYQIHKSDSSSIYTQMYVEIAWVVVVMSIINFSALFVANHIWSKQINRTINFLRETMHCVGSLSLKFPKHTGLPHNILTQELQKWQQIELERAQQINTIVRSLPTRGEEIDSEQLKDATKKLQHLLTFVD